MNNIISLILSIDFVVMIIRVSTPVLLSSMGILISDQAGIANIGTEGAMLSSALVGVLVSAYTQSAWIGLAGAVICGIFVALLLSYMTLNLKTDPTLGGIAINQMAVGGTVFFMYALTHDKGNTIALPSKVLPELHFPLIEHIPVVGKLLSGHNIMSYIGAVSVLLVWFLFSRTALGIRIRAAGKAPHALESVGVSVRKVRYIALILSGLFAGLGGAFMSMGYVSWFARNMTAERGFMAFAAMTMGRGSPGRTLIATLFFGTAEALSYVLQATDIPTELIQATPYLITVLGLILFSVAERWKKEKLQHV